METMPSLLNQTLVEKQNLSIFINHLSVRLMLIDEMHNAFYHPDEMKQKNVSRMLKETLLIIDTFNKNREHFIKDEEFDPTKMVVSFPLYRIAYVILEILGKNHFTRVEFETIEEFIDELSKWRIGEDVLLVNAETIGLSFSEDEIEKMKQHGIFLKSQKDV